MSGCFLLKSVEWSVSWLLWGGNKARNVRVVSARVMSARGGKVRGSGGKLLDSWRGLHRGSCERPWLPPSPPLPPPPSPLLLLLHASSLRKLTTPTPSPDPPGGRRSHMEQEEEEEGRRRRRRWRRRGIWHLCSSRHFGWRPPAANHRPGSRIVIPASCGPACCVAA